MEVGAGAAGLESGLKSRGREVSGGGRSFGGEGTSGATTGCETVERLLEK